MLARPSRTALRVAMRRAAHQLFDAPLVLDDPLAVPIVGEDAAAQLTEEAGTQQGRVARAMRAFIVVRSRLAEDELARAVGRGAAQYVVLGAGLDTFAYRSPFPAPALRVFEVDHPATQEWKRHMLETAAIPIPPSVTFAPVDFERQTLEEGLALARFDPHVPTFFSWLGVTMYLTEEAVMSTLRLAGSLPRGGGIVFDYAIPRSSLGWMSRLSLDELSRRVAAAGEPFQTFFDPGALGERLAQAGFRSIEDLDARQLTARYFRDRADGLHVSGSLGRLISAEV